MGGGSGGVGGGMTFIGGAGNATEEEQEEEEVEEEEEEEKEEGHRGGSAGGGRGGGGGIGGGMHIGRGKRRRQLLGRDDRRRRGSTPQSGAFSTGYYGCNRDFGRAKNENHESGAGKRISKLKTFTPGQAALVRCIKDVSACGAEAAAAADELPSIKLLRALPRPTLGGPTNFRSCAIVAGGLNPNPFIAFSN